MTPTLNEIEDALAMSVDVMRMAEQVLRLKGSDSMADYVRDRAEKNMNLLLPWARR